MISFECIISSHAPTSTCSTILLTYNHDYILLPGCQNGAIALSGSSSVYSYMKINNNDKKLSYGPSMSFFINMYHNRTYCSILEYGTPGHVHPSVDLHFNTYWRDINDLYFGLAAGNPLVPNPWFGTSGGFVPPNEWHHVGFTYDSATAEFK